MGLCRYRPVRMDGFGWHRSHRRNRWIWEIANANASESDQETAKAIITTTSATDVKVRVSNSGVTGTIASNRSWASIVEVGTTDSTLSSDRRLKRNIEPLASISDDLALLQPVLPDWRSEEYPHMGLGTGRQLGLVAQDVEKVLPQLVT